MTHRARRNLARAAGLALVASSLLLLWTGGNAGADGPAATLKAQGWWWEANSLPGATIPPPPTVNKGQLNVQSSPTGKAAFSAVRYELSADHHVGSLALKIGANGDQGGSGAVLLACRTGSAWSPADAGQWSAAPKVDTNACVNGQKATDGTGWTFAVGPLQTGAVLDIAIVPGVDPSTKQPGTFSITFDAPSNDSLGTVAGAAPSAGATPATFASSGSAAGSTAETGALTSHPAATSRPSLPPTATGLPGDKVGQTATSPANQAASQPGLTSTLDATNASSSKPNKTAGYVVLVFAALVGLYAYRQDNLMARNGGVLPGAEAEVGGLGRFSKSRSGQPPALT
jgi:hypothetical protein